MSVAGLFVRVRDWLLAAVAQPVAHASETIIHTAEKDIKAMATLPQNIEDALASLKSKLATAGQAAALQQQVTDLTNAGAQKDQQIADLTQQLSDATDQLQQLETALLGLDSSSATSTSTPAQ